jgi:excisionase family DNA binding protein
VLDLIRPDGSVIVPAGVAGEVLRSLVRDLTARVRTDGGEVSPTVRGLLNALHAAAERVDTATTGPSSDPGTTTIQRANVEIGTGDAAALLECSTEYVRRLARSGRIQARRLGAAWLIDSASLDAYRTGAAPCPAPKSRPPP